MTILVVSFFFLTSSLRRTLTPPLTPMRSGGRFFSGFGAVTAGTATATGAVGAVGFKNDEDETEFSLVDTKPKVKPKFGRKPFRQRWAQGGGNNNANRRGRGNFQNNRFGGRGGGGNYGNNPNRRFNDRNGQRNQGGRRWGQQPWQQQNVKDLSLAVQADWKLVEETNLDALAKAGADTKEVSDLYVAFLSLLLFPLLVLLLDDLLTG